MKLSAGIIRSWYESHKISLVFFLVVFFVSIVTRLYSVQLNTKQHGDVALYSATAESIAYRNNFLIDPDTTQPYFYSLKEKGGRLLEHNPLWPILAAPLVKLGMPGYIALKFLSFLSGVFLLILLYGYTKKLGGELLAKFVLFLSSISYVLIDYSGNGSFYVFEACLYIAFLWLLLDLERPGRRLLIGVVLGLGWVLNQQALAMFFTYVVTSVLSVKFSFKKSFQLIAPVFLVMFAFFLPWGLRNANMFGSFFYNIDTVYLWQKLGMPEIIDANNIIHYPITLQSYINLLEAMVTFWFPHNLYFINRKLFVLAPVLYVFAWFFTIESAFAGSFEKIKKYIPIFLLLFFHICISAPWPIAKFRYLVPILPLIFLLGGLYITQFIASERVKKYALIVSSLAVFIFSVITYLGVPSHTYYYEGVPTSDIYGKQGEKDFFMNNTGS